MKSRPPIWPVALMLVAGVAFSVSDLIPEHVQVVFDEKWLVALVLGLFVVRAIFTILIGQKPNPKADVARMQANIRRGLSDRH